jgi:hypothetical protein
MAVSSGGAGYRFFPWVRCGLAAAITATDPGFPNLPSSSVTIPIAFDVNTDPVQVSARLYGPDHVGAIDGHQVVRTDPSPGSVDFEPNFFASIEFFDATLPWLFTPLGGSGTAQLRPWVCLVVVEQGANVTLTPETSTSLAVLRVQDPGRQLPSLADSWAWAHGQVAAKSSDSWQTVMDSAPAQSVSRLVCSRRLRASTRYLACVVPAFEVGRLAGLGEDVTITNLQPAWPLAPQDRPVPVVLPVYYSWEFATGPGGDFESLVRLLWENLPVHLGPGFGTRPVDASAPGCGLSWPGAIVAVEGALCAPPCAATPIAPATAPADLGRLLAVTSVKGVPIVGPPVYGSWYTMRSGIPASGWVADLNLGPRYRVAASLGALVVHNNQEQLMASAWDQLASARQANQALVQAQLARTVNTSIHVQRLTNLGPGPLLQLTQPIHSRVATDPTTLSSVITASRVPDAAFTPAFRRAVRPQGPMARRFGPPAADTIGALDAGLLVVAPDRTKPDGAVSMADVSPQVAISLAGLALAGVQGAPGWQPSVAGPDVRWAAAPADQAIPEPPRFGDLGPADLQAMSAGFRQAAAAQLQYVHAALPAPPQPLPLLVPSLQKPTLMQRIHPDLTVPAAARTTIGVDPKTFDRPDPLDPITDTPRFQTPMAGALADLGQDLLLPGLSAVPPDSAVALQANARFVEAFMVGLNEEMGRELLWRGYPSHQLGTYFRRFWADEVSVENGDIPPIQQWDGSRPLGANSAAWAPAPLVLIIRSRLFQRYPNAAVYATKAVATGTGRGPGPPEKYPIGSGRLDPDLRFFLFDLDPAVASGAVPDPSSDAHDSLGWYFVIQQHPTEPRFGLEPAEPSDFGTNPPSWALATWGNLVDNQAALDQLEFAPVTWRDGGSLTLPPAGPSQPAGPTWGAGSDAGQMAAITLRHPLRVAIHASAVLPSGGAS